MIPLGLQADVLVVVGEGTCSAKPDMAELTVSAQTTSTSATQALRENAERMLRVVQVLTTMGISQADIETTGLSVYPLHLLFYPQAWQPGYSEAQPIVGYRVSSAAKVLLRDMNRGGDILDAAVGAGANFGASISFRLQDDATVRRTALEAAGKDARVKAEMMAAAVGKQLGDLIAVAEETLPFPVWGGSAMGDGQLAPPGFLGGAVGGANSAMPVWPSNLTFRARLQIVYKLSRRE